MEKQFAQHFANEWVAAWNSHDIDRIMSHYSDDIAMHSPVIVQMTGEKSGRLQGKDAVRAYWEKALRMIPTLHFELISYYVGVTSIVIQYTGHRGISAETFIFNNDGKVAIAYAHYEII